MAEDRDQKTEAPTGERLEQADSSGQVAYSADLSQAILLLAGIALVTSSGGALMQALQQCLRDMLTARPSQELDVPSVGKLLVQLASRVGTTVLPMLFGLIALAYVVGIIQVGGFRIRTKALDVKFERLDPVGGASRLFSLRSLLKLATSLLKLAVVIGIAFGSTDSVVAKVTSLGRSSLRDTTMIALDLALSMLLRIGVALLIIGSLDYLYQRWQLFRDLRMTKQEVRDEAKNAQGNPQIKNKQRAVARNNARRRMFMDIPTATAVITNPTHFAVAVRYRRPGGLDPADEAPIVVAKGADLIAKRIREIATEAGVPIVENPPLARALYRTTEIGSSIPPELYRGVAEVLAFVFRLRQPALR